MQAKLIHSYSRLRFIGSIVREYDAGPGWSNIPTLDASLTDISSQECGNVGLSLSLSLSLSSAVFELSFYAWMCSIRLSFVFSDAYRNVKGSGVNAMLIKKN